MTADPSRPSCVAAAWQAHERELQGYLTHRLGDHAAAEDVLQEVFLKALRQGEAFCNLRKPRAWLFEVARNALVDRARLAKPTVEFTDDASPPADELSPVDALADDCVHRTLFELSPEDREVIRACDLDAMPLQAFADAHGLSLPAVKARLRRGRQRLRDLIIKNCQVRFDDQHRVCCYTPRAPTGTD